MELAKDNYLPQLTFRQFISSGYLEEIIATVNHAVKMKNKDIKLKEVAQGITSLEQ